MKIKILDEGVTSPCKKGNIIITGPGGDSEGCENCRYVEPFTPIVCDGCTWWCLSCNDAGHSVKISDEDRKKINEECQHRELVHIDMKYEEHHKKKK